MLLEVYCLCRNHHDMLRREKHWSEFYCFLGNRMEPLLRTCSYMKGTASFLESLQKREGLRGLADKASCEL